MGPPPSPDSPAASDPTGPGALDASACAPDDALLLAVCAALMGSDPSAALDEALAVVGRGLGADAVFLLGATGPAADVIETARWCRGGVAIAAGGLGAVTPAAAPALHAAFHAGQELRIDDASRLPDGPDRAFWNDRGVPAVLAVTIASPPGDAGGRGMLGIGRRDVVTSPWTPAQLQALHRVAGPLGLALSHHRQSEPRDVPPDNVPIAGTAPDAASREQKRARRNAEFEAAVAQRTRELAESERRHRRLAEYASDMISAHDAQGRFIYVSHACGTLLGHAPYELIGTRPQEWAHPEDRDEVLRAHAQLREAGGAVRYTWRGRSREGDYVWLESACRNYGSELVVVTREVGGRLQAEMSLRLLQSAVEQVNEGVVITDAKVTSPGPTIVYVNPAFIRMTGYSEEELVGRTPGLLQGPETDGAVLARTRAAMQRGEAIEGEAIQYRRDGSTYLAHWTLHPLRDVAGNLTHWVSVQRDASERRADEDLERRHREELAHVTRLSMMGEMVSGLAHEINQPLTSISTYIEGLQTRLQRDDLAIDVLADILGRVADQAGVASQIVRRLRAFVLKRGTVRADESVNNLVRETLALLASDLKPRRIEVRVALGEGLPTVFVDGVQIQQVLVNLIRNAVEATEAAASAADGAPLAVELVTAPDGPGGVRIEVIDRGVGLTSQQLDRIFDPFFSTKDDGMGMGLTISRSIAEAHGGRLSAVANPRRGCTFSLVLPPGATSGSFGRG